MLTVKADLGMLRVVKGALLTAKGEPVIAVPLPTRESPTWKVPETGETVTVVPLMAVIAPTALETEPLTLWPTSKLSAPAAEIVRTISRAARRTARL